MPFHDEQLQWMIDLSHQRTVIFDYLFRVLNYFDTTYFALVFIPLVWIGFSYRWGIRLYYLLAISAVVNTFFKDVFQWPRPGQDFPGIGMYPFTSFGFPSGGAQTAMLLGGLLIHYWKNRWAWAVGMVYILLLSFARLYLGAHYPMDVLGGWILGFILLVLFIKTIDPVEQFLKSKGLVFSFILSELVPAFLWIATAQTKYHRADAMVMGLGIFLSLKYHLYLPNPKKIWEGILRGLLAIAGVFILYFVTFSLPMYLKWAIVSFWISLIVSPLIQRIGISRVSSLRK